MKVKAVSGIMLTLLLIGMLTLAFNIQPVKASGTIYITSDYTFTHNIYEPIVVLADNIVIDGNGYTLQGTGSGRGIDLSYRSNVKIKNINIKGFDYSIYLGYSFNNVISGNNITNNGFGIYLYYSSSNTVSGNNITNNLHGVVLHYSSNYNTVSGNNITNNAWGIELSGPYISRPNNNIISGNNISNGGVYLSFSYDNRFYHNNFIDIDLYSFDSTNVWDNGYPSGGNYWSDHVCTGNPSDGSQPYIIDANNIDHYPFQDPNGWINTLTIYSSPTGVTFTVDGVFRTTPWSGTYSEGTLVSLVMPEIHSVGDARYCWNQWSDGVTTRSRTVTMNTNITLTAQYTGPYYQLTVTSSPITGIPFTINGAPKTTPYTEWLLGGSYTLIMPQTHNGYVWSHWQEDGDTNRIKTITLQGTTWTAVYVPAPPPPPPPVGGKATQINIPTNNPELPTLWIWLTIILPIVGTAIYVKRVKRRNKKQ